MSFENGNREIHVYLQLSFNCSNYLMLTLTSPSFFQLQTLIVSALCNTQENEQKFKEIDLKFKLECNGRYFLIQSDHDVLRMQEDDVVSILDSLQETPNRLIYLRDVPLDSKDIRAQSLNYEVHAAESTFDGIELLRLWNK